MIDHAIRFRVRAIIHSKHKEVIIDKIFKHWIALFGTPNLFLSNNGGEFNNIFREMDEQLNINIKTTAAESPWSNRIVEKHNGIIENVMEKVLLDVKCSLDVALAWCLSAKNSLLNSYGYSPNQLVFGYNPNFPSVLNNQLPVQNGVTSRELIASHLNSLQAARKRFIETEADEKLRRGLRHKARTAKSLVYQNGEQVCYKKNDSQYWKGPEMVIGIGDKQVFVRHEGIYVRLNPCNLQLVNDPVKDHTGETVDNDSQDVQNYSKENQNINADMIIKADTENVSNEFEEKKDKKTKIGRLMMSQI